MLIGRIHDRQETRCAIYTRQSVEPGAEQDFGSLDAQRSICASYIASQRPKGWKELPKHYDDAGQSGATLTRPALQDLLTDLESGLIDVVVVYKLDRITRTLLDFVRLMDLFEHCSVGFVAVTQNFDTADSTGRLILNILLTFAQFEREMMSDRLKDKFSTMRQRGMFVGGNIPYGYDLADKRLVINAAEAEIVRWIYQRYLEVKSCSRIALELKQMSIVRRSRISKRGNLIQGRGICKGSVFNMLANQLYVGNAQGRGGNFKGQHDAIIGTELWDAVQTLRAKRTRANVVQIHKTDLLRGLMYDSYGRKMASYRDYRYRQVRRYYISNQSEWGRRHGVRRYRTRAEPLERLVVAAISSMLADRARVRGMLLRLGIVDRSINKLMVAGAVVANIFQTASIRQAQCVMQALVERIELSGTLIKIVIRMPELPRLLLWDGVGFFRGAKEDWSRWHLTDVIDVPSNSLCMKREISLLLKRTPNESSNRPKPQLVRLLKRARAAQAVLDEREFTQVTELAKQAHCHPKKFTNLVRLNYLAPDIIASILDGTQPPHVTCTFLRDANLPMDWTLQRRLLGFPDQPDYLRAAPGW